jgi:structural maintenance of chromosome 4
VLLQDTNAKAKAIRDIEDNSEKMEKEKTKADQYEASLVAEEKILEGIRDSLKGMSYFPFYQS